MASVTEDDPAACIELLTNDEIEEAIISHSNQHDSIPNFNLVLFDMIPKSYPVNEDVTCHFILTQSMQRTPRDWIGLYKIGWTSPKKYQTYEWVPPLIKDESSEASLKGSVKFLASYLPKDDGEFYQFCYVVYNGNICGASTPFQFKRINIDDIIEVVDKTEELMIVQSKATFMEERLKKASNEQRCLEQSKNKLQKEKDQLQRQYENILSLLEDERKEHCQYIEKLQGYKHELEIANQRTKCMKEENEHLVATISQLTLSNEDLRHTVSVRAQDLEKLEHDIKKLIDEKNFLNGEIKIREEDLSALKKQLHDCEDKYELMRSTLTLYQIEIEEKKQAILTLKEEITTLKETHKSELKNNEDLIMRLQHNVILMETQCKAAEKCQEMLTEELSAYSALREKLTTDIETSQGEAHSLKLQLTKLEDNHKKDLDLLKQSSDALQAEVQDLRKNNELLKENLDKKVAELTVVRDQTLISRAQLYLKQANECLQKQYNDQAKHVALLAEKLKISEAKECCLQKEVLDLKERLRKGAKEWHAKYFECQSLKKMLSQNSCSLAHSSVENCSNNDNVFNECNAESVLGDHKYQSKDQESSPERHSSLSSGSSSVSVVHISQIPRKEAAETNFHQIVTSCLAKKEKYRNLYKIEQERCLKLERQLIEKEQKLQDEIKKHNSLCQDLKLEYQRKIYDLQRIHEPCRGEFHYNDTANLQRISEPEAFGLEFDCAIESLDQVHSQTATDSRRDGYSLFPNCGNSFASKTIPESVQTATIAYSLARKIPSDDFTDVLSSSDEALSVDNLPPPLQATVLPSSKIAAINAVSRQMSPSLSATVDNSEIEVFTDGDNDADRSSSISPGASLSRSSSFVTNSDIGYELAPEDIEPSFRLCPVCAARFSITTPFPMFEDHVYTHYGPICPMCNVQFSTDFSHGDFSRHVYGHFED